VDQKPAAVEISFLAERRHASRPPGCVRDPIDDIAHQAKFCAQPGCRWKPLGLELYAAKLMDVPRPPGLRACFA
jgi:hypothetical protein